MEHIESEIKSRLDTTATEFDNLTEDEFQMLMANQGDLKQLTVEVVYATNQIQLINEVQLARGASIEDGIMLSGILNKCPEIDLSKNRVGIYGVIKPLSESLSDGDRIEIYRPVTAQA